MRLYYAKTSPFVRKVMACAVHLGIEETLELLPTNPWESPAGLVGDNPLSKVPCLVTDDGMALVESSVICEYLDATVGGSLFPAAGAARWRALRQQAVADGMTDAAVMRRMDGQRPREDARDAVMARQAAVVSRGLNALEADVPTAAVDIGTISVGCALGYLDFRFSQEDWRQGRPGLAAWFASFSDRPELTKTRPE